jgi:hypothetical protein
MLTLRQGAPRKTTRGAGARNGAGWGRVRGPGSDRPSGGSLAHRPPGRFCRARRHRVAAPRPPRRGQHTVRGGSADRRVRQGRLAVRQLRKQLLARRCSRTTERPGSPMGRNARSGSPTTLWVPRPPGGYSLMRRRGAIVLDSGGDCCAPGGERQPQRRHVPRERRCRRLPVRCRRQRGTGQYHRGRLC